MVAAGDHRYRSVGRPAMHGSQELGIDYGRAAHRHWGRSTWSMFAAWTIRRRRITDKMPYNYFLAPLDRKSVSARQNHSLPATSAGYVPLVLFSELHRRQRVLVRPGRARRLLPKLLKADGTLARCAPCSHAGSGLRAARARPRARASARFSITAGWSGKPNCLKFHKSKRAINTASYQQVRKADLHAFGRPVEEL